MNWIKLWTSMLMAVIAIIVASIVFGVWGFGTVWLVCGLVTLVAFLKAGGQPGGADATGSAGADVIALVISGPIGFFVIFETILETQKS